MSKRSISKHSRQPSKKNSRSNSLAKKRKAKENKIKKIDSILKSKSKSKSKTKSETKSKTGSIDAQKSTRPRFNKDEIKEIQAKLETRRNARNKLNKTIQKKMPLLKNRVRAKYLDSICSDSGVCIAFGQSREKIGKHFNHFLDFSMVTSPPTKIGATSNNGFVYEVPFNNEGYNAHAILKSSSNQESDNLMYEYMVGIYINAVGMKLPCFLETYGLFMYKNGETWSNAMYDKKLNNMENNLIHVPNVNISTLRRSCANSLISCVLIQHLKEAIPFVDVVYNKKIKIPDQEVIHSLFQVYFCLHCLRDEFTHYDLHSGNVLLYEPVKGKKIRYTYEDVEGNSYTFDSAYIPKIIDYGRSYFSGNKGLYEALCQLKECDPDCGFKAGYGWMDPTPPEYADYHISSMYPNCSHDLRLYNIVKNFYKSKETQKLKSCVFRTSHGTPPVVKNDEYQDYVANVTDAYRELAKHLQTSSSPTKKENILAHIHVKQNEDMIVKYTA